MAMGGGMVHIARRSVVAVCLATLGALAACESPEVLTGASETGAVYRPVSFDALPGWSRDDHQAALTTFLRSCDKISTLPSGQVMGPKAVGSRAGDWQAVCAAAWTLPKGGRTAAKAFFAEHFQPWAVTGPDGPTGTFTGYYEATLEGSFTRTAEYNTPIYGVPSDLRMEGNRGMRDRGGLLEPYPDRTAIETGAINGVAPVLLWARDPVDVHILHIQGSGQVRLPDGRIQRIGYAANNGHRFVGIGKVMRDRGLGDGGSMPAIRAWLKANRAQGVAVMRENPRYIFFRLINGEGPIGAQGVPLTPERSLAVDKRSVPLGAPVWLATTDARGETVRRLMVAQDTGSAITGAVRGDFFWGGGEPALYHAGGMKSPGRYWVLFPKPGALAQRAPRPSAAPAVAFDPRTL